ncbi:tigger transposable element-derived protein 1-like [Onthophagus taurus]|uniref:tigger transposable element-derived protein 1-like n=1 Tax=Onthophagus taurus TaxID=166361 RepID=UPI0039BE38D7
MRVIELAKQYNKSTSTICTILKNKEKIKSIDAAKGLTVNVSTKQRPRVMEEVEKLLLVWINEKQLAGDSISEGIVCEKAKMLHANLLKDMPDSSSDSAEFKASRGWFEKFKRRTRIHSIFRHGEAASADIISAEEFISEFKTLIETEQYIPQQVFNCDETGLFWKKCQIERLSHTR